MDQHHLNGNEDNRNPNVSSLSSHPQQSQILTEMHHEYNESRAIEAQNVERQLTKVAHMMTQLADLVEAQRHTIIHININTDESIAHVEGAIEQLQKYLAHLSGNRWLMIKVFAILIFIAIIFFVFIA
ncbi:hypothetical protein RFI_00099 [Reticulomyxa filosa]|uniref:t-SNARE coiled-coil homology domain-containing protein n=1 Tax=Reticulomyxa filosa TaxID=46433 RepID=X6PEQ3_RETFI|nr:hypothetical protein RFI_00099 [Reticulomyxa filosa]|eukprot:ETO36965.1 hypothetical protein RFI_00099 [Reticulomyxa filosa]